MCTVLQQHRLQLLHGVFLSAAVTSDDIEDAKYTLQKKISEVRYSSKYPFRYTEGSRFCLCLAML